MATMLGRTTTRPLATKPSLCPCMRPASVRRVGLVVRKSSEDAVKQLEQFSAGVRAGLKEPMPSTVPITPPDDRSPTASASSSSIDGGLLELNKDSFWEYLKQQGDTLVVVDFFTDWCGPCKLIYPELVKLSHERTDVRFVKFNCNKANKELGMTLGIKVAPTFHLYRNATKIADMTGAKLDKLMALIDEHQPPASSN